MNTGLFDQDAGTWTSESKQKRPMLPAIAAAAVLSGSLLTYTGYAVGSAPVDRLSRERDAAVVQDKALSAEVKHLRWLLTHCQAYEKDVQVMKRLISHGLYGEADALGELDLSSRTEPGCPGGIGRLWYESAMLDLYGKPALTPLDETPVLAWDAIRHKAVRFGVTQDSPLTVFVNAFNSQNWPLAKSAYIEALRSHVTSTSDRVMLEKAFAVYRNIGHVLAFRYAGQARAVGIRYLATANVLGKVVHRDEAAADLVAVVGAKRAAQIAPDRNDPVVVALGRDR